MPVIATDQWLKDYLNSKSGTMEKDMALQREILCRKLIAYFPNATAYDIHHHLLQNGLFLPSASDQKVIEAMCRKDYWKIIVEELKQLISKWNGPDIPVFIFPSNLKNKQLRVDFNGRSGLAYQDKICLFISSRTSEAELQALLTHEYNHVCRLQYLNKKEEDIQLLDAMVLEGMAEMAVYERLGKKYLAKWTSIYSLAYVLTYWSEWFAPNLDSKKIDMRHNLLMYGDYSIPKWLGYNMGFHLVASFAENKQIELDKILRIPSKVILDGSAFA